MNSNVVEAPCAFCPEIVLNDWRIGYHRHGDNPEHSMILSENAWRERIANPEANPIHDWLESIHQRQQPAAPTEGRS